MAHAVPRRVPGLVIGGSGSNSGKTVTTLALLCALKARGLAVYAAKTGPDFIDAAFHAALTETPAANLDVWMCREARARPGEACARRMPRGLARLLARAQGGKTAAARPDMLVLEGAMGLYDGGAKGVGSTAQLAALLGLPVLLILNTHGLGQSAAALAEGFLRHCPAWSGACGRPTFAGILCTHVGGERHAGILREALAPLEKELNVPLLGLLPRAGAPRLDARHLGLVEAREAVPCLDRQALAAWLESHCRLDALLGLLGAPLSGPREKPAGALPGRESEPSASTRLPTAAQTRFFPARHGPRPRRGLRPLVGMAWDAAFSFCYADLPATLQELGAELVFFSPLKDKAPPRGCHGLYFPGGYPELHAQALAANGSMRDALQRLAARGVPIYGECGGYIYLMHSVRHAGKAHAMSGLLPLHCEMGETRAALGYRAALALRGWPGRAGPGRAGASPAPRAADHAEGAAFDAQNDSQTAGRDGSLWARGHEFHYGRAAEPELPPGCRPLWELYDSRGVLLAQEGCRLGSVAGSWLHLYPEGSRRFWRAWLTSLRFSEIQPQGRHV